MYWVAERIGKSENQALRLHCYKKQKKTKNKTKKYFVVVEESPCLLLVWSHHLALPSHLASLLVCPWNLAHLPSPPVGVVAWAPVLCRTSSIYKDRCGECLKGENKVICPHSSWTREDMLLSRFLLLKVLYTKENINQALSASPEDSRLGILFTQEGLRCKVAKKNRKCPHSLTRCHSTVFLCPFSSLVC